MNVTPIGLDMGVTEELPVLRPDGFVETFFERHKNEEDYAEAIRAHEHNAPPAANQA